MPIVLLFMFNFKCKNGENINTILKLIQTDFSEIRIKYNLEDCAEKEIVVQMTMVCYAFCYFP